MSEIPGFPVDPRTLDGKQTTHESSRPFGTTTGFTSQGDATNTWDGTVSTQVWGGSMLKIEHGETDGTIQQAHIDFNVKENRTFMHEGYIMWEGATFDTICLDVVPTVTPCSADSSTSYNLYEGYLITPAAPGTGTIKVDATEMRLVEMPLARDTGIREPGYWNADYDTTTHTFSNITPDYTGGGIYNMFGAEIPMVRFVNRVLLLSSGFLCLQTADVDELGHGMRLRLTACTNSDATSHQWKAGIMLTLNREKLV